MILLTNLKNFLQIKKTFYNQLASFSCLLNEADEFKEIQDGRSKMADTKMTILSLR